MLFWEDMSCANESVDAELLLPDAESNESRLLDPWLLPADDVSWVNGLLAALAALRAVSTCASTLLVAESTVWADCEEPPVSLLCPVLAVG